MSSAETSMEMYPESKYKTWKDWIMSKQGMMCIAVVIAIIVAFYWVMNRKFEFSCNIEEDIPTSIESPVSDIASSLNNK